MRIHPQTVKRILMKQPASHGRYPRVFFTWLICFPADVHPQKEPPKHWLEGKKMTGIWKIAGEWAADSVAGFHYKGTVSMSVKFMAQCFGEGNCNIVTGCHLPDSKSVSDRIAWPCPIFCVWTEINYMLFLSCCCCCCWWWWWWCCCCWLLVVLLLVAGWWLGCALAEPPLLRLPLSWPPQKSVENSLMAGQPTPWEIRV